MSYFDVILFDLDDTLMEFALFFREGLKLAFRNHRLTRDLNQEALLEVFMNHRREFFVRYEQGELSMEEYRHLRFAATLEDFGRDSGNELTDDLNRVWFDLGMESLQPDPALVRLLDTLSGQFKIGVVSNGARGSYEKLERLGVASYFPHEAVFIAEELGIYKPEPGIYQRALDYFGAQPEKAVFVGDSWEMDVVGPLNAGMAAVWLNPHRLEPTSEHKPLATIRSLEELPLVLSTCLPS